MYYKFEYREEKKEEETTQFILQRSKANLPCKRKIFQSSITTREKPFKMNNFYHWRM